jgi:hypothetical protein
VTPAHVLVYCYCFCGSWLGYEVISLLLHSFVDPFTRVGIGTPLGIVVLSWFVFLATPYVGYSLTFSLAAMDASLVLSLVLHLLPRERHKPLRASALGVVAPCVFVFWFIYNSLFPENQFVRGDVYGIFRGICI